MLPLDFEGYVAEICKGIKSRPRREEVMEELLCHLEDNFERNIAVGMTEEEARLNAIKKMGDSESLSYYLTQVNSSSPLNNMNSALIGVIGGFIGMNFLFSGAIKELAIIMGIALMFSPLLRMRTMNKKAEKAFHFFNFSTLSQLFYYCISIGTMLPQWVFYVYIVVNSLFEGLFWIFLFSSIQALCDKHLGEEAKRPKLVFCGAYYMLLSFFSGYVLFLSEGEKVTVDSFVLPIIVIFMLIYTLVQLFRAKNLLWAADSEYGIQPADKKHRIIYYCVVIFCASTIISCNYFTSTKEPVRTELIIHDVSQEEQKEADKVREKMLKWDVDPQIVEDLPDSEILKYKDAEFVTFGADGGYGGGSTYDNGTSSDLYYYWFFIPDKEYEGNYDVRLLCYIESHYADKVKSFYRKGFYYMPWQNLSYGIDIFPLNFEDELNGSYIGIITEENGKKYNAEPFFTYRIKDTEEGFPTDYPKGFEYREEKGQRVYFATQFGVATPEEFEATIYAATVRQRWFTGFNYKSSAEYIKTILKGDSLHIPQDDYMPYYYRLHNIYSSQ